MKRTRSVEVGLGIAAVTAVAAFAGERLFMRREKRRPDPAAGDELAIPDQARHHMLVTSDGGTVHVVETGDPQGRPLVLLPGVTLTSEIWAYQLTDLADRFRVLAFDQRGHGRSVGGDAGFAIPRLAADLAEALEHLDLHDAIVVGHSMGGMTALQFVTDFPDLARERVAGLVLLCTTARAASRLMLAPVVGKGVLPTSRRALRLARHLPGGMLPPNNLSYLLMRIGFGKDASPTHVEFTRRIEGAFAPEALATILGELFEFDLVEELAAIDRPTLVIAGEHDHLLPDFHAREMARRIPNAELVVLPGCGHMPMLERRVELERLITTFADSRHGTTVGLPVVAVAPAS